MKQERSSVEPVTVTLHLSANLHSTVTAAVAEHGYIDAEELMRTAIRRFLEHLEATDREKRIAGVHDAA